MSRLAIVVVSIFLLIGCGEQSQPPKEDAFRVVMIQKVDKSDWQAIRYNRYTGEAWYATSGAWERINDDETVGESLYTVKMAAMRGNWGAIRMDVHSGKSWRIRNGAWVEMPVVPRS